jgi:hypothetical protein
MESEGIKARISIGKHEQGDIAFIYDFNLLKKLNVAPDDFFTNYHFLSIGAKFELGEKKYKVTEIKPLFYEKTFDMSNPPGFNMYGIGEQLDYNFEIALFVEEI